MAPAVVERGFELRWTPIVRCRRSVIESSCARWNGLHMQPPQTLANGASQAPEHSADQPNDASTYRLLVDAAPYGAAV